MSASTTAPTTLPALPEGQFFRVRGPYGWADYGNLRDDVIELRETRRFGRSRAIDYEYIISTGRVPTEAEVAKAAETLLANRARSLREKQESDAIRGDYPPKILGGAK